MKKVVVFLVLAMVVVGACAAQSATSNAQALVGTWVGENATYVFNANGTGTCSSPYDTSIDGNIFWGVSISGELYIKYPKNSGEAKYYLSPDGKRMLWNYWVYQKK